MIIEVNNIYSKASIVNWLVKSKDAFYVNNLNNETYLFDLKSSYEYYNYKFGDLNYLLSDQHSVNNYRSSFDIYFKSINEDKYIGENKYKLFHKTSFPIHSYKTLFDQLLSDLSNVYTYNENKYYVGRGILAVERNNNIKVLICCTIPDKYTKYYNICKSLSIDIEHKIINMRVSPELLSSKDLEFKGLRTSFKRNLNQFLKYNIWQEDPQFIIKQLELPKFKTLADQKTYINEIKDLYKNTIDNEIDLYRNGVTLVY